MEITWGATQISIPQKPIPIRRRQEPFRDTSSIPTSPELFLRALLGRQIHGQSQAAAKPHLARGSGSHGKFCPTAPGLSFVEVAALIFHALRVRRSYKMYSERRSASPA